MILKPEELDEVVITKINFPHVGAAGEGSTLLPSRSLQQYTGVYDGTITNGVNFIAVGSLISDLFKKEKEEPKKKIEKIDFQKLVQTSVPGTFFSEDLKLKAEEKELFIQFCDADQKSKTLLDHPNILATMDFLTAKNDEFKKLKV